MIHMPLSEPREWTQARRQRMEQMYPLLASTPAGTIVQVDNYRAQQGQMPSDFGQSLMRLAARAGKAYPRQ